MMLQNPRKLVCSNESTECDLGFYLIGGRLNVFRLESLECGDVDVCDQGVELVHGVFVLVPQSGETDSNAEGNVPERNWNFWIS